MRRPDPPLAALNQQHTERNGHGQDGGHARRFAPVPALCALTDQMVMRRPMGNRTNAAEETQAPL
ncbi:hypothetical protein GCM10027168_41500 [Streptomyces capparidis]